MQKVIFLALFVSVVAIAQNFNLSPNMSLPVPVVGVDPGPDWADNLNSSLTIIDGHNHTPGSGVQVPTSGININSNLTYSNFAAVDLKACTYQAQTSYSTHLSTYVIGNDLYYTDGAGNVVRITASGAVAGTPGSISGLVSPASATYNPGTGTFIWQSNTNTAAIMDAASIIVRKTTASSNGITISAPSALASNYGIILPALPGTTQALNITSSGTMGTITYDNIGVAMTATGANAIAATMTSTGANAIGATMTSTGANAILNTQNVTGLTTNWAAYTPTLSGITTTGVSFIWRKVGQSIEVIGQATVTAGSGSELRIQLPNSFVVASLMPQTSPAKNNVVGTLLRATASSASNFIIAGNGNAYVNVSFNGASSNPTDAIIGSDLGNFAFTCQFTLMVQ